MKAIKNQEIELQPWSITRLSLYGCLWLASKRLFFSVDSVWKRFSQTSKLLKEEGYVWLWSWKANKWLLRVRSAPPIRTPYCRKGRVCQIPPLLLSTFVSTPHKNLYAYGGPDARGRWPEGPPSSGNVWCGEFCEAPFLLSEKNH